MLCCEFLYTWLFFGCFHMNWYVGSDFMPQRYLLSIILRLDWVARHNSIEYWWYFYCSGLYAATVCVWIGLQDTSDIMYCTCSWLLFSAIMFVYKIVPWYYLWEPRHLLTYLYFMTVHFFLFSHCFLLITSIGL